MKPPLRTKSVGTKASEAEFAMMEECARVSGLTLSEWVRDVLLAGPGEPGAELEHPVPGMLDGEGITSKKVDAYSECMAHKRLFGSHRQTVCPKTGE